jgi:hypothetical protein
MQHLQIVVRENEVSSYLFSVPGIIINAPASRTRIEDLLCSAPWQRVARATQVLSILEWTISSTRPRLWHFVKGCRWHMGADVRQLFCVISSPFLVVI